MYKQLKKMRQEEGFTLIELLIVIVILGILAAIVVFSVQGITDRGTASACKSDITTVETAAEASYAATPAGQTPAYPATMAAMVPNFLHSVPTDVTYSIVNGTPVVTGLNPITTADPTGC